MSAPTVSAVDPTGWALGGDLVSIQGAGFNLAAQGTVRVRFGGRDATEVKVWTSGFLTCKTPPGELGLVDVEVANVTPPGPVIEPTLVVGAFTYKRQSIATPPSLANHPIASLITRQLVDDLVRTVLEQTSHDTHPDYADAVAALLEEEKQAAIPSLKVIGPRTTRDRFNSENARVVDEDVPDLFDVRDVPLTLTLTFDFVGVGRTSAEAQALFLAVQRYFHRTPFLAVTVGTEVHEFEMAVPFDQAGDFRGQATRQGTYQFNGSVEVRGVNMLADPAELGFGVEEVVVDLAAEDPSP